MKPSPFSTQQQFATRDNTQHQSHKNGVTERMIIITFLAFLERVKISCILKELSNKHLSANIAKSSKNLSHPNLSSR